MSERPTVPASSIANEELREVRVYKPDGKVISISREQMQVLDLGGLAVAWKDAEGAIHRAVGLPIETISVESRIVKPV